MKRMPVALLLLIASGAGAANTDKTLVSWVTITDKNVRSGSVLTVQVGQVFDGIIFAERAPSKWMAGSNGFVRTGMNPQSFPLETADKKTQVQMAIVYKGDAISIYRNAKPYASYKIRNVDLLSNKNNFVVFGLRHIGGDGSIGGAIDDARIYSKALNADELKSLAPNKASTIKPYAWWDFQGDKLVDRAGRYPHSKLSGGAKLSGGKLVLGRGAMAVCAATKAAASASNRRPPSKPKGPHVVITPMRPENPPSTWLTYHLAHTGPDRAIPGDPNCAIYYKGKYHLHYIFQNHGHSFAHVTSTDMVHWKWRPTVLTPPITGHGMFSGTAFMTQEGKPAIIYHGQGSRRNQIAIALDDNLDKWTPTWPVEPKIAAGKPGKMRHWDPDCWLRGDTYYALGGGGNPTIAKSKDLKNWEFVGELFHKDFPDNLGVRKAEDVSCANMFKIGNKWMLLCISHGLGARYYLGDFKGEHYLPTHHAMMNWARWDCFAPETLLTPDGRRVMWAWCTPWVNGMQKVGRKVNFDALFKSKLQPGIQCLPRELSLPGDGVLRIKPLRELEKLRRDEKQVKDIIVKGDAVRVLKDIAGDAMELEIVIAAPTAKEFGVNLLCDKDGKNGYVISHGAGAKKLKASYSEPPFELKDGEDLKLRIFIDKSMIEVFANDRQAVVTWHEYDPKNIRVSLFSRGGELKIKSITAWNMKSIYPKKQPDPIHFTPKLPTKKTVGDVMPFFWKGEYHVFYLTNPMGNNDVNWEHCSSKDLVNWREYPPALKPDHKNPTGSEGGCMFTGCIVEKEGVFHAWYTSWNPKNPKGREFLSHATSKDLIVWKKHPEHMIAPDGIHYANHRKRDFRDPQIFWNAETKEYWMHVLANSAKPKPGAPRQRFGLLKSKDLVKWTQHDPVAMENAGGDECPDYFKIGATHYIHSCRRYYYSDKINGPYKHPKLTHELDRPGINAAKRVWDGKRHVWFGGWSGGVMPLPREVYAGPDGLLYMKPVEEVTAVYKKTVLDLSGKPAPAGVVDTPEHYMLDGEIKMDPQSSFSLVMGGQYRMTLSAADGTLSLVGPGFKRTRPCPVDASKPVKIQVFTEGKLIECFINDQFAQSCVVRKRIPGQLKISAEGGAVTFKSMRVRTAR
ncbi:MAG: GH32 C-terminal domain-containing protein [Phycisphaerae bacterium]|nr:GH32 C-terminal domain-containing protein [Phycisphaerae bacterium]